MLKMILIKKTSVFLTLLSFSVLANAVEVVECEDENGSRGFFKNCPPGSTLISKKSFKTKRNEEEKNVNLSVTHYFTPNCGACEQVREFFQLRKIEIIEKNVNENIEIQGELTNLAGALRVTTVVIGEDIIQGFDRKGMLAILDKSGWKDPNKNQEEK